MDSGGFNGLSFSWGGHCQSLNRVFSYITALVHEYNALPK